MRISSLFSKVLLGLVLGFVSITSVFAAPPSGNSALQFASGQYCTRSTPISTIIINLTMQCWVKWDGTNAANGMEIFYNGNAGTSGYGIITQAVTQNIGVLCGATGIAYSTTPLVANTWQHLALVRDAGGTWSLYVNGVITSLAVGITPNVPAAPLTAVLGRETAAATFRGQIDEVSFWDTPMSGANILANKDVPISASHPNIANLIAYYQLNEGTGQTAGSSAAGALDLQLGATAGAEASDPTWVVSDVPLVPTLGEWGMIALAGVLLYAGYRYISRRKTAVKIA